MAITLNPEQEEMVARAVAAGLARDPSEALDKAVRALLQTAQPDNLAELLANSPLAGAGLDLTRSPDHPRPIDLE